MDELAAAKPGGHTGLAAALHEAAEKVPQRALIVVISDLFIQPEELRSCFQHLRFRKHDVAVFHLLEQSELDFDFDRPIRFVDLEGGTALLADPSLVAKQYRKAVEMYTEELADVIRDTAIDYQRVSIEENYGEVLARFLLGRAR